MDYIYNTISTSGTGITFTPTKATERPKTPPGLIVTNAVQTKDGWLAQVIVDKEIVFEELVTDGGAEDAIDAANTRVVRAFKDLFAEKPVKPCSHTVRCTTGD